VVERELVGEGEEMFDVAEDVVRDECVGHFGVTGPDGRVFI
jgi:hypothetical protein